VEDSLHYLENACPVFAQETSLRALYAIRPAAIGDKTHMTAMRFTVLLRIIIKPSFAHPIPMMAAGTI